ncbi:MAG: hypothetical protein LAT68_14235 [Cyclobacteriaceae bacterium]|nr:hypothetical protein [Cyclobacteriaceae bacterium]
MKWYHDKAGKPSTMRIIAMVSSMTGCAAMVAGGIALFMGVADAVQYAALGAGMAGLGEVAKAWQSKGES